MNNITKDIKDRKRKKGQTIIRPRKLAGIFWYALAAIAALFVVWITLILR